MSALCQKQTSHRLFDHLVGARKQGRWDGKTEPLGRIEVDDEFKLCRLLRR
jgi:hypothetical protein